MRQNLIYKFFFSLFSFFRSQKHAKALTHDLLDSIPRNQLKTRKHSRAKQFPRKKWRKIIRLKTFFVCFQTLHTSYLDYLILTWLNLIVGFDLEKGFLIFFFRDPLKSKEFPRTPKVPIFTTGRPLNSCVRGLNLYNTLLLRYLHKPHRPSPRTPLRTYIKESRKFSLLCQFRK